MKYILFLLGFLFIGCFEIKQDFTINPDGSGKVNIEVIANSSLGSLSKTFGATKSKPEISFAQEMIKKSSSIDVWKDISYSELEDGRLSFKGTAYFSDIRTMKIDQGLPFAFEEKDGQIILTMIGKMAGTNDKKLMLAANTSKDQRMAIIQKDRNDFNATKTMVSAFLNGIKIEISVKAPGKLVSSRHFQKDASGKLTLKMVGEDFLKGIDEAYKDDKWIQTVIAEKGEIEFMERLGQKMNEKIFGEYGYSQIVVKKQKDALFDFTKEVEAAKPAFEEFMKSLGEKPAVKAAKGEGFSKFYSVGATLVHGEVEDVYIRPSYKLNLVGEFAGSINEVKKITLNEALTDNGESLYEEEIFSAPYPTINYDKNKIQFEIGLKYPTENASRIKSLKGDVVYSVGEGKKDVEIKFSKIEVGAKGALESEIVEFGPASWEGYKSLKIKIMVPESQIKEVKLYDAKKHELTNISQSAYGDEGSYTITFTAEGEFPSQLSLSVSMYDKINTYTSPFELKNVDLFGRVK